MASSPTQTNSRSGSPTHSWITRSTTVLAQVFSGRSPSCVACSRIVSLVGRLRRAPVLADQRLDRRPVDDVERMELSGAGEARIDRRRVDDQEVLDQHAQPVGERMAPVGPAQRRERRVDAGGGVRQLGAGPRSHGKVPRRDLVLARLDDGAQKRQRVGEGTEFGKGNAAFGARDIVEVQAERIVELPPLDLGGRLRRQRLLRPEPGRRRNAADGVARSGGLSSRRR